jgi:hypothetical protein
MLVCALYSGFVEETKELRQRKPKPDTLFELFCTNVYAVFTAANPQRVAFMVEKGEVDVNGIAFEFLWEHLRRQGILTYQDFYGNGKRHPSKVVCLVRDFVHFVAAKGFENGAANCASDPSRSQEARRFVLEINTGVRKLKPV